MTARITRTLDLPDEFSIVREQYPGAVINPVLPKTLTIITVHHNHHHVHLRGQPAHHGFEIQIFVGNVDRYDAFWVCVFSVRPHGFFSQ
jgi:hypothetical protein